MTKYQASCRFHLQANDEIRDLIAHQVEVVKIHVSKCHQHASLALPLDPTITILSKARLLRSPVRGVESPQSLDRQPFSDIIEDGIRGPT